MKALVCASPGQARTMPGRSNETTFSGPGWLPLTDGLFLIASLWMVYWIEVSSSARLAVRSDFLRVCLWVIPLKLLWLGVMGEYRQPAGRWEASRWSRIWLGLLAGSGSSALLSSVAPPIVVLSASAMVADFLVSVALLLSFRLLMALRWTASALAPSVGEVSGARVESVHRLAVVGTGPAAEALVGEAAGGAGGRMAVTCFVSDDPQRWSTELGGVPVVGPAEVLLRGDLREAVDEVVVAEPGVTAERLLRLQRLALEARLKLRWLPLREPVQVERVRLSQRRALEMGDLLEAEPGMGASEMEALASAFRGRTVMITGAGGAVGRELGRRLMLLGVERLVLVDLDEDRLCETQRVLSVVNSGTRLTPLLADVQDMPRLHDIFERHQPQVVFHAAVQRQALLMEREPAEAVKVNTLGTVCAATLAMQFRVQRFVLVSSLSAADPANVVAATRRLAEVFVSSLTRSPGNGTQFVVARAGEMVHARSALVTRLREQVNAGGPVRLHEADATRRLFAAGQVAELVLQCGVLGEGGEVFGLDPERALRSAELAELLILLSGHRPGDEIRLDVIGGAAGPTPEPASGTVIERILPTAHPRIWLNFSPPVPSGHVQRTLYGLFARLHELDADELRRLLLDLVSGFRPAPMVRPGGGGGEAAERPPGTNRQQDRQWPELN